MFRWLTRIFRLKRKVLAEYRLINGIADYPNGTLTSRSAPIMEVINGKLKEGYELLGGPTFVTNDMFIQAIVKWKKE